MSRRDDIEMLAYSVLFLLKKVLPWETESQNGSASNRFEEVLKLKAKNTCEEMFKGCPYEFAVMLKYSKSLRFDEKPDYAWLNNNFKELYKKLNFKEDTEFDWLKFDVMGAEEERAA
jgi:hypothetical protein